MLATFKDRRATLHLEKPCRVNSSVMTISGVIPRNYSRTCLICGGSLIGGCDRGWPVGAREFDELSWQVAIARRRASLQDPACMVYSPHFKEGRIPSRAQVRYNAPNVHREVLNGI